MTSRRSKSSSSSRKKKVTLSLVDDCTNFVTVGYLAKAVNRSPSTIRRYVNKQLIPAPTHCNSKGWPLYTANDLADIVIALRKVDQKSVPLNELSDEFF